MPNIYGYVHVCPLSRSKHSDRTKSKGAGSKLGLFRVRCEFNNKMLDNSTVPCSCLQYPRPIYVGADLASTPLVDALVSKGFKSGKRTLFTCEGIFCYLPQVLLSLP